MDRVLLIKGKIKISPTIKSWEACRKIWESMGFRQADDEDLVPIMKEEKPKRRKAKKAKDEEE